MDGSLDGKTKLVIEPFYCFAGFTKATGWWCELHVRPWGDMAAKDGQK